MATMNVSLPDPMKALQAAMKSDYYGKVQFPRLALTELAVGLKLELQLNPSP